MRKKSSLLYKGILFVWLVFIAIYGPELYNLFVLVLDFGSKRDLFSQVLLTISGFLVVILILYFWLNGLKDIFYTLVYWFSNKNKLNLVTEEARQQEFILPCVDLIYTVCDDFDSESLRISMNQDYPHSLARYHILDDSKKPESLANIDEFARENNLQIFRRNSSRGYKAGNINNWLEKNQNPAPYFVILDSDEVIPANFVSSAVKYFVDEKIAIVQGNHIATRDQTPFAELFSRGVESHWKAYQAVKNRFGFMSLLGHGAMLKTEYIHNIGGFPEVVAEDLALSIKLAQIGKTVVFAPEIMCEETYPVDYFAFKKRHAKWTMGNMEFIKKFSWLFLSKNMTWFEKMDILLFTYNLPLTVLFITFLLIHLVLFPVYGFSPMYSDELLVPTILTLIAPLLNDLIYFSRRLEFAKYVKYFLGSIALYGSLYFLSFIAAVKALFGEAVFLVTPKKNDELNLAESTWKNKGEIGFGTLLFAVSFITNQPWSVVLIIVPTFLSVFLGLLGGPTELRESFVLSRFYQIVALVLICGGVYTATLVPEYETTTGQVAGVSEEVRKKQSGSANLTKPLNSQDSVKLKTCLDQDLEKLDIEKCRELVESR